MQYADIKYRCLLWIYILRAWWAIAGKHNYRQCSLFLGGETLSVNEVSSLERGAWVLKMWPKPKSLTLAYFKPVPARITYVTKRPFWRLYNWGLNHTVWFLWFAAFNFVNKENCTIRLKFSSCIHLRYMTLNFLQCFQQMAGSCCTNIKTTCETMNIEVAASITWNSSSWKILQIIQVHIEVYTYVSHFSQILQFSFTFLTT